MRIQPSILAIVVLYKRAPAESESLSTLLRILKQDPHLARHFSLVLYDNSPEPHPAELTGLTAEIPVHYKHDPTNAGLATAYNYALAHAVETKHEWLLLLDQDTSLTEEFVVELMAAAAAMGQQKQVASIVPKLLVSGKIYSPSAHFIDQLRRQYKRSYSGGVVQDLVGVQPGRLGAYNSGATLRVSALQLIGGFPEAYWLDYLDHAVFHALMIYGFSMYVLNAMLEHGASQADQNSVPLWRLQNIMFAQTRFVKQTGNFFDRLLYRILLLRWSRGLFLNYPDRSLWREAAVQALFLRESPRNRKQDKLPAQPSL